MKKYKVKISDPTLEDMEEVHNYIALDWVSPDNAIKQYNRIVDAILTLEKMPNRIRIMDSYFGQELRIKTFVN